MKKVLAAIIFCNFLVPSAFAADVKIGFVTTLTTPAAVIGKDMKNAVNKLNTPLGQVSDIPTQIDTRADADTVIKTMDRGQMGSNEVKKGQIHKVIQLSFVKY